AAPLTIASGLALMVASLLAPTLNGDPTLGTRYFHFTSAGLIVVILGIALLLTFGLRTSAVSTLLIALLFTAWIFHLDAVGNYSAALGTQSKRLFYQLHTLLPSVREDTVVLLRHSPGWSLMFERVTIPIFRTFTNTSEAFLLSDAVVKVDDDPKLP